MPWLQVGPSLPLLAVGILFRIRHTLYSVCGCFRWESYLMKRRLEVVHDFINEVVSAEFWLGTS